MKIEILGPGCPRCDALALNAKVAADKLGERYELVKVRDLNQITSYGVIVTPALVVNGSVKLSGKVASAEEIEALLRKSSESC